ncbi:hypothetical protein CK203_027285 [Vitis vinifera]|uniref:Reverse transcriptase domain-containing protein n=1 Tax=Vitis vinifera TaxID=29760 RepID=A0A438J9F1_VITVI|nr:hypothetical protein CK203_027285 [Vitis vinifera]
MKELSSKLTFEKAYDHVNWDFLDHVLEKKGFSPKWRNWMRGCLSLVSYVILVNERLKDVLSRMMLRAEERSMLEGFRNHLSRLALLLDCKAFNWPILFLGLPLGGNPIACGFWDPVIERISRRLDGWKRLTYLSVILALVAAKIERLQRDFLWSGVGEGKRDHLASWDVVCKPRGKRGIGVWEDFFKKSRSFREVVVEVS